MDLPLNASKEDIELEISVCELQLQTLDPCAADFESQTHDLESRRDILFQRLGEEDERLQQLCDDERREDERFDLSDSEAQGHDRAPESRVAGHQGRKRTRDDEHITRIEHVSTIARQQKKRRNTAASHNGQLSSRSSTQSLDHTDSTDEEQKQAFWRRMESLAKREEERIKAERDDYDLALALQQAQDFEGGQANGSLGRESYFGGASEASTSQTNFHSVRENGDGSSTLGTSEFDFTAFTNPQRATDYNQEGYRNAEPRNARVDTLNSYPVINNGRSLPSSLLTPELSSQLSMSQVRSVHSHGIPGSGVYGSHGHPQSGSSTLLPFRELDTDPATGRAGRVGASIPSEEELHRLLETIRPDEVLPLNVQDGELRGLCVTLMEHQRLGLNWLIKQELSSNRGGILADDMGLGKTVQTLALILARPSEDTAIKTNLIVAPVSLMRQWAREVRHKTAPFVPLTVYTYYGNARNTTFAELSKYDIVLTTFGTVAAELKRKTLREQDRARKGLHGRDSAHFPLFSNRSRFYRVIIDEAQFIKNKSTRSARSVTYIAATYRLCLTGTPMMNRVDELFSLIRFLRIPPYNDWEAFNRTFARPLANGSTESSHRAMQALQALLKAIMLRRTKESKINGRPILNLTKRNVRIASTTFDDEQKRFYESLENRTRLQFNRYLKAGTVGKNYSNVLVLLLRLRQACCHPHLIKNHAESAETVEGQLQMDEMESLARNLAANTVGMIKDADGAFECPICYDATDNPKLFFPCGHHTCFECLTKLTDPSQALASGQDQINAKCPQCRQVLDVRQIINYTAFKKVHLPEQYAAEFAEESHEGNNLDEKSAGEDSDSGTESGDDDDSQPDLGSFVVKDGDTDDSDSESDFVCANESKPVEKSTKTTKGLRTTVEGVKRKSTPSRTLAQVRRTAQRNEKAKREYLKRLRRDFVTSAKLDRAVSILKEIRENDPLEKTIVFSQFTSFLDLFEVAIHGFGWKIARYDGSLSPRLRNDAVSRFFDDGDCQIMLVSLKAGNAGLNLNCASQVIILDPFWNPFIEEQAIDRAHRIGQERDVTVNRILIQNTVEDRICALQEKKRTLISEALSEKAGQNLSRLSIRDLAYLFGANPE